MLKLLRASEHSAMIVGDDFGYSDIGAFGGEISAQNLDALAKEGKIFTQSSWSNERAFLLGCHCLRVLITILVG